MAFEKRLSQCGKASHAKTGGNRGPGRGNKSVKSSKTGRSSEYSRNMTISVAGAQQARKGVEKDEDRKGKVM